MKRWAWDLSAVLLGLLAMTVVTFLTCAPGPRWLQ